jgi:hypothetical protein
VALGTRVGVEEGSGVAVGVSVGLGVDVGEAVVGSGVSVAATATSVAVGSPAARRDCSCKPIATATSRVITTKATAMSPPRTDLNPVEVRFGSPLVRLNSPVLTAP